MRTKAHSSTANNQYILRSIQLIPERPQMLERLYPRVRQCESTVPQAPGGQHKLCVGYTLTGFGGHIVRAEFFNRGADHSDGRVKCAVVWNERGFFEGAFRGRRGALRADVIVSLEDVWVVACTYDQSWPVCVVVTSLDYN